MISPWVAAGWCLAAYLIGGLPIGWLLVRRKRYGLDLRKFGTGNIGTSNVYRHAGIDIAVIVGPLQFLQGFAPVLASRLAGLPLSASMLIGVCTVAGNGWPVYMKFNGGRGVAVATGAVAGSFTVNCGEPTLDFHGSTAEDEPLGDSFPESNRRYLDGAVNEERQAE